MLDKKDLREINIALKRLLEGYKGQETDDITALIMATYAIILSKFMVKIKDIVEKLKKDNINESFSNMIYIETMQSILRELAHEIDVKFINADKDKQRTLKKYEYYDKLLEFIISLANSIDTTHAYHQWVTQAKILLIDIGEKNAAEMD